MNEKTGKKGYALEELLKSYFGRAGYFSVRGVPFRHESEDITDIDLWLYERPGASTRRRLVVDIKNRRTPRASERIIWTKGLQFTLGVDSGIVATTDKRESTRRLAKRLGIVLLDGDAITKISQSDALRPSDQLPFEDVDTAVKAVDKGRRSSDWAHMFRDSRASLLSGFGVQSANKNLEASAFFAEQAVLAPTESDLAKLALRLMYFTSAIVAISLDFILADHAFADPDERKKVVIDGLRFGQSDKVPAIGTVQTAIGLARQYADNGPAVAKQIEYGFYADADRIPAEIVADYVSKVAGRDTLFTIARDLEGVAFAERLLGFDRLSIDAKAFVGVLLDFNGITRERIAAAWTRDGVQGGKAQSRNDGLPSNASLFDTNRKAGS